MIVTIFSKTSIGAVPAARQGVPVFVIVIAVTAFLSLFGLGSRWVTDGFAKSFKLFPSLSFLNHCLKENPHGCVSNTAGCGEAG
jgi:hypothetical protein